MCLLGRSGCDSHGCCGGLDGLVLLVAMVVVLVVVVAVVTISMVIVVLVTWSLLSRWLYAGNCLLPEEPNTFWNFLQ